MDPSTVVRRRVVITGRVQGVWFRDSLKREADARAVSGYARNRSDGAVEAELEGSPGAVEQLVAWCGKGPSRARVDEVATSGVDPVGGQGFTIR